MSCTIITHGKLITGAKSSIGATALALASSPTPLNRGVTIKAASTNSTNLVYVGISTVTANSDDTTDGIELAVGDSVTLEIDDLSKVYVIGSTTGLKVFWAAI